MFLSNQHAAGAHLCTHTLGELFMQQFDQYLAISQVRRQLKDVISREADPENQKALKKIDDALSLFHDAGIDFKEVVDSLDDSLLITDADGTIIYINPAYTVNTGIKPEELILKNIDEVNGKDSSERLFSGGAVPDVLQTKKPAFRLSTTFKDGVPKTGYVVGTPVLDEQGNIKQVIALSRPIITLKYLKNDFDDFVGAIRQLEKETKTSEPNARELTSSKMIGKETTLSHIWQTINQVAASDATVLITGESGAGKEVIADEIYLNSNRKDGPFVKINCASIPGHLLESELFGYEKGAFSGASAKGKKGLFEMANNGTLMLDEIGDMPLDLQAKLLRAIQSQEITRIGGTTPIKLNIRFLALTNSNLMEKIANKEFRQDLYYRLNVIPIYVPPLRERIDDIEPLCRHFIAKFSEKYNRPFELSDQQYRYMRQYDWPGNIRELENIMEYLVLCSSGIGTVDDHLLTSLLKLSSEHEIVEEASEEATGDFNTAVAGFEKQLIEKTLKKCSNLREAGKVLGINASTISRKIKQYNIDYQGKKEI